MVVRQAWLGNADGRKVLLGGAILAATALIDIASDLRFVDIPAMLPIGFAIVARGNQQTRAGSVLAGIEIA